MFWPRFIDLHNFILLVRTVSFFQENIFISSYTEKNNYFLLYELIQDLPYSVTMNIFRKKNFLFKSFAKVELSYVVTINLIYTVENCMKK